MTCWVVIPVKAPHAAKSRLAGVLSTGERARLAEALLERAVSAVQGVAEIAGLSLIGPEPLDLPGRPEWLADPGGDLNRALDAARTTFMARGTTRLITLAGDLPLVGPADVRALITLAEDIIGIAPDRHGTGTNALSLPLPAARDFAYAHGPGSLARHRAEARRLGLVTALIDRPGLARDVDEPADLDDAAPLTGSPGSPILRHAGKAMS